MSETFEWVVIDDSYHYTVAELNELFRRIQLVVNRKLDADVEQQAQVVCVGQSRVLVGDNRVLLEDPEATRLITALDAGNYRIINLKEGTAASDAITVGQARRLLA